MGNELEATSMPALAGVLVDAGGLAALAAEAAARQRSPETRRTYAAVYRSFGAFLGPDATPEGLTPEAVRRYRGAPPRGRSPPAPGNRQVHELVGHRPLRQARAYPRGPAR